MPTVLIIDDDHATRTALEMLLKKKKFGVFLAPDGPTGIRLVGNVSFDAVVNKVKDAAWIKSERNPRETSP